MTPTHPCPWCGAIQFGVVDRVMLEMTSSAKKGWGNVLNKSFAMVVCKGCGATQLFSPNAEFLEEVEHKVVEAPTRVPFR